MMTKNKIILIILTFLIFACEDKEDDVNPLVGQWNMTDFSSGTYMRLNKTQEIFMGDIEGSIEAKTISNGITTDTYNLTEVDIYGGDGDTFIDVYGYDNYYSAYYSISDYTGSLSSDDQSNLSVGTQNSNAEYYGTNFLYFTSTNLLKIRPDTLYRQLYINGNEVWDSTRYAIVEGAIEKTTEMVQAGQDFLMNSDEFGGDIGGPDELTLILNDDGTGRAIEEFNGGKEDNEIKWVATDSTFSWNYCYDGDCDGEGPEFNYEISGTNLSLSVSQDICEDDEENCDYMVNEMFGIEFGTLEAFWLEMNVTLSSTQVAKKSVNKMFNKRSKFGNYSFINGLKPPKRFAQ